MSKKTWIKVKRGLIVDPKHRRNIGSALWFFLYLIDRADWETGIVEHKHDDAAHDMGVVRSTIQEWYETLKAGGYISAQQRGRYGTLITLHNWVNPREYSGEVLNETTGHPVEAEAGENTGDEQGTGITTDQTTANPPTIIGSPTYDSHITPHIPDSGADAPKPNPLAERIHALCKHLTDVLKEEKKTDVGKTIKVIVGGTETTEQALALLDRFETWWYSFDWRGAKNQPPKPAQIRAEWPAFLDWLGLGRFVGVVGPPQPDERTKELAQMIREQRGASDG